MNIPNWYCDWRELLIMIGWVILITLAIIGIMALCVYFSPDAEAKEGRSPLFCEKKELIIGGEYPIEQTWMPIAPGTSISHTTKIYYEEIEKGKKEISLPPLEPDWDRIISIIIQIESGGNPNAVSKTNCRGLMQISEITFKEFIDIERGFIGTRKEPDGSITNIFIHSSDILYLYDPEINKYIGLWYLKLLKKRLGKDYTLERLLASYNMGLSRLKELNYEWWRIKETRNYIKKYQKLAKEIK